MVGYDGGGQDSPGRSVDERDADPGYHLKLREKLLKFREENRAKREDAEKAEGELERELRRLCPHEVLIDTPEIPLQKTRFLRRIVKGHRSAEILCVFCGKSDIGLYGAPRQELIRNSKTIRTVSWEEFEKCSGELKPLTTVMLPDILLKKK